MSKKKKIMHPDREVPISGNYPDAEWDSAIQRVFQLMVKYPKTRDSDKLLWLAYLQFYCDAESLINGWASFKKFLINKDVLQMATIIRSRAKIQEEGYLRGELWKERQARAETTRLYFAPGDPDFDSDYSDSN